MMEVLKTADDLALGARALASLQPRFAHILDVTGPLPLRRRPAGFKGVLYAIVGQQISTAAARAVWGRLEDQGVTERHALAIASEEDLRALGLSRQKIHYAQTLARSPMDFAILFRMPDEEVIEKLVVFPGIGRWTAEIYLMFALGRADVFAAADLALQEGARLLFELPERPSERDLRAMAVSWRPWRSIAAQMLWAYYRHVKEREGVI